MKASPLKLGNIEFPVVSVRANVDFDDSKPREEEVPVTIEGHVSFDSNGGHFSMLEVSRTSSKREHNFEIQAFVGFSLDGAACREVYGSAFSPVMVSVNVARILFSAVRDMLSTVSARSPYGIEQLESVVIESSDIKIGFESGKRDEILAQQFGFSSEQIAKLGTKGSAVKTRKKKGDRKVARKETHS